MKTTAGIVSLAAAVLVGALGCSTVHNPGTGALQGTWKGREIGNPPETPRQLVISGSQIEYPGAHPNDWGRGHFTFREGAQPKQIVVALTECGFPQYIGKTSCFIYKIEDGTLTVAANEPGNTVAPLSFDAPHARHMIFKKE